MTSSSSYKIISWNVNGIQSVLKKDANGVISTIPKLKREGKISSLHTMLAKEDPDIVCLQEIRCSSKSDSTKDNITSTKNFDPSKHLPSYPYQYINCCTNRKGYSGTLVLSKILPTKISRNCEELVIDFINNKPLETLLCEGRIITLYFEHFILVNVYVPNAGVNGLQRLKERITVWEPLMRQYLTYLQTQNTKVIVVGDLNVVHQPLDWCLQGSLANVIDFAGATFPERNALGILLSLGFIDTYRHYDGKTKAITWYCREGRSGCRLDYSLVTTELLSAITSSTILNNYRGSDHYPISLTMIIAIASNQ